MPTLLLDSCATQRPSNGARLTEPSRRVCRSRSATCSAAGPGLAAVALGAGRPPGSRVLPPAAGAPVDALPARAGLSVAREVAAMSVGVVVDSRCQTNQPAPPRA